MNSQIPKKQQVFSNACMVCGLKTTFGCSQCKQAYYCSSEHQRQHWPAHSQQCLNPKQLQEKQQEQQVLEQTNQEQKQDKKQDKFDEREQLFEDHERQRQIAIRLISQKDYQDAILPLRKAIEISAKLEKISGKNDFFEKIANYMLLIRGRNIILNRVYLNLYDFDSARKALIQTFEQITLFSQQHHQKQDVQKIVQILQVLAQQFYQTGDQKNCESAYVNYVTLIEKYYGENSASTGNAYFQVGVFYLQHKQYTQALACFKRTLNIRMNNNQNDEGVADCWYNIGVIYKQTNKKEQAIEFLEKALRIRREQIGSNSMQVASCLETLGKIYMSSGDLKTAYNKFQECYSIRKSLIQNHQHHDVERIAKLISQLYQRVQESVNQNRPIPALVSIMEKMQTTMQQENFQRQEHEGDTSDPFTLEQSSLIQSEHFRKQQRDRANTLQPKKISHIPKQRSEDIQEEKFLQLSAPLLESLSIDQLIYLKILNQELQKMNKQEQIKFAQESQFIGSLSTIQYTLLKDLNPQYFVFIEDDTSSHQDSDVVEQEVEKQQDPNIKIREILEVGGNFDDYIYNKSTSCQHKKVSPNSLARRDQLIEMIQGYFIYQYFVGFQYSDQKEIIDFQQIIIMSIQTKFLQSPKYVPQRKISLFNDSINLRSTRNQSFDVDRKKSSNIRFRNSGSVLKSTKANDYSINVTVHFQYGQQAFKEGNISDAIKYFQDCLNIEPLHMPSRYMLGAIAFSQGLYDKALKEFKIVKDNSPKHNKNMYIIMALALKKQQQIEKSILILSDCLLVFPDFYDALIFKGKMELKLKRYQDSENSFKLAIKLNPQKSQAYQFIADCYRSLNQLEQALKNYQQAIIIDQKEFNEKNLMNYLKTTVCLYEMSQYEQADGCIDQFLQKNTNSSEGYKLKAQILQKLGQKQESMLFYEQCIKCNNSRPAVTKAVIEIAKYRIEQKDFYELNHTLQRIQILDIDLNSIKPYAIFAECILELMKRKNSEAMILFEQLEVMRNELPQQIREILLPYRGYCFMMINEFQRAYQDFQESNSFAYNQILCLGIINFSNFSKAYQYFEEAKSYNQIDPVIYQSILLMKTKEQPQIQKALNLLFTLKTTNIPQVYYLRSVCLFFLNIFEWALKECNLAIDKSDENVACHYYLRGLLYAKLGDINNGMQDFSLCINMDQEYYRALLQRSKCYCHLNEMQYAFQDMQQYIYNVDDYFNAGCLLMLNGLYEDALKTFQQDPTPSEQAKVYMEKCQQELKQISDQNKPQKSQESEGSSQNLDLSYFPQEPLQFYFDMSLIDDLGHQTIEIKPQAPWIKKNSKYVQFTENLLSDLSQSDFDKN
ncbi:hypothetical protein pb186bvf_015193 [Paramecium bursaria]